MPAQSNPPVGAVSIRGGSVRGERSCLDKQILCQEPEAQAGSGMMNVLTFHLLLSTVHEWLGVCSLRPDWWDF